MTPQTDNELLNRTGTGTSTGGALMRPDGYPPADQIGAM
jgi:hypothetical protein